MADFTTDTVIIGAGVIGLAIAKTLAERGKEVLILEELSEFGKITSSRNSGVIHAGIYYPEKSLKAKMCVEGNKLLYDYAKAKNINQSDRPVADGTVTGLRLLPGRGKGAASGNCDLYRLRLVKDGIWV